MGLLRRGGLGILMFAAALVLMPVLVLWYRDHPQPPTEEAKITTAPAATATDQAVTAPPVTALSTTAPDNGRATPALLTFVGVTSGAHIQGNVRIRLDVRGSPGMVRFDLTGTRTASSTSTGPDYVFTPDTSDKDTLWDTTAYPNGSYTLTARAVQLNLMSVSVTFRIFNTTGNPSTGSARG